MSYILRKTGIFFATLFFISVITFFAFHIVPGNPALMVLGTNATEEQIKSKEEELGVNKSLTEQYVSWLYDLLHGDFGTSTKYNSPVSDLIANTLPVTLIMGVIVMILVILFGIPLGFYGAYKRNTPAGGVVNAFTIFGISIPPVFAGILVTWIFGLILNWFIPGQYISYQDSVKDFLQFIIFPVICITVPEVCVIAKYVRSSVLAQMDLPYVRTARSKGNGEGRIMMRHIFRNAIVSIVPLLGMMTGDIFAGSIIIEQVFGVPGIGRLLISAVSSRDFPLTQVLVLYIAVIIVIVNFLVDILIKFIDPRISFSKESG